MLCAEGRFLIKQEPVLLRDRVALFKASGKSPKKHKWLLYLYVSLFALALGTMPRMLSTIESFKVAPITGLAIGLVVGCAVTVFYTAFLILIKNTSHAMRRNEDHVS